MGTEYRLRIDGDFTPATFPMERLGEYLSALAKLLGETPNVHFSDLITGSSIIAVRVDDAAAKTVVERVRAVHAGNGPADALKAYGQLDALLWQDGATATLVSEEMGIVIPFRGKDRPEPVVFGPFKQDSTVDGQVIRVGGTGDTIPVHLRDGDTIHSHLYGSTEVARKIAQHLFGPTVRVHGTGTWFRTAEGVWELRTFRITEFEVLGDEPLVDVVRSIRAESGSIWNELPDPVRHLMEQRRDEGDLQ